jgi:predicted Rossmann-fold nucleotide-binding protein
VSFLDHMTREGFLAQSHRDMVLVEEDPDSLVRRLREYQPPTVPRWIEATQT